MNKQMIKLVGVSDKEYRKWCKENKKAIHKRETKEEFFGRILDGKIGKSEKSGDLIKRKKVN